MGLSMLLKMELIIESKMDNSLHSKLQKIVQSVTAILREIDELMGFQGSRLRDDVPFTQFQRAFTTITQKIELLKMQQDQILNNYVIFPNSTLITVPQSP